MVTSVKNPAGAPSDRPNARRIDADPASTTVHPTARTATAREKLAIFRTGSRSVQPNASAATSAMDANRARVGRFAALKSCATGEVASCATLKVAQGFSPAL